MKADQIWWRVSVTTAPEAEDAVAEMLGVLLAAAPVSYFDLEFRASTVSVFCAQKPAAAKAKAEITAGLKRIAACGLKTGAGTVAIGRVRREDWAESWKRHFHPLEISPVLLIKPGWSRRKPRRGQAVVVLDPGLSFGTGQHPTTSFCLGEIARNRKAGTRQSFLDIGTGSGILAIAAAKLGYQPVRAFDFDPAAVRVAKANARRNRMEHRVKLTRGDITRLPLKPARPYDLVCANLMAPLLIAEKQRIVNRVKPGGTLVLAGILAEEFATVERAYGQLQWRRVSRRGEREWASGAFCRVDEI